MSESDDVIRRNIVGNNRVARLYDDWHPEIFTDTEQTRLRQTLSRVVGVIDKPSAEIRALDFGCGSGNVTRHLIELGYEVTACDVAAKFLGIVAERWQATGRLQTALLNGKDLSGFADGSFDLVTVYSVLHHLPDYLGALEELHRVLRPGGVLYLDHEVSDGYWLADPVYEEFVSKAVPVPKVRRKTLARFFRPSNYINKIRDIYYEKAGYRDQGDIHVFPEDHIEWVQVEARLRRAGMIPVVSNDYLLFRAHYNREVYEAYRTRCSDVHVLAMQKAF